MRETAIRCPTCGAPRMRRVMRDVTTRTHDRPIVVPQVAIEECPRCGERLYDLASLRRLAEARRSGRPRRPAA